MRIELCWLAWTLLVTLLACFPYVLNRFARRGLVGLVANPSSDDMPLAAWAQRAQRAHANAVENLVVFAPAVLAVVALHREDSLTAIACGVYFAQSLARVILNGLLGGSSSASKFGGTEDTTMDPREVARTYRWLVEQHPSVWTHEIDVRPSVEKF